MPIIWVNDDFGSVDVHRSGWKETINNLKPYLEQLGTWNDIIIDTYVDATFDWRMESFLSTERLPYTDTWIGFIHHTTTGPNNSLELFKNPYFRESLEYCKGLIVLSQHLLEQLRHVTPIEIPLYSVQHPTAQPFVKFDLLKYICNSDKRLLHVGNWMRDIEKFLVLPELPDMKKTVLKSIRNDYTDYEVLFNHVSFLDNLSNEAYDEILSENIVCIYLHDASAINTVIECVVRETPIALPRLPAIVELLGKEYPMYVESSNECFKKIGSSHIIAKTNEYLQNLDKRKLSFSAFNKDVAKILEEFCMGSSVSVNEDICSICLDGIEGHENGSTTLSCNHVFGTDCLRSWLTTDHHSRCPICRNPVDGNLFNISPSSRTGHGIY